MRLHLLEHDDWDFSDTNITRWAKRRGHRLASTDVFTGAPLPALDSFDWLLVMGGSQHAWEEDLHPWLAPEKAFIARVLAAGKPVVGICFGAQLLAEALGGRVFRNAEPEVGWHEATLTGEGRRSPVTAGLPERFVTFHWHSDHFSLPPGCRRLAESPPTPNQVFACEAKPAVGIQFHPEYTREMVLGFAAEHGHEWVPSRWVPGAEAVAARTRELPDTYWLLERLLDNLTRAFAGRTTATN